MLLVLLLYVYMCDLCKYVPTGAKSVFWIPMSCIYSYRQVWVPLTWVRATKLRIHWKNCKYSYSLALALFYLIGKYRYKKITVKTPYHYI